MEQYINDRGVWQIIQKGFAYVSDAITIADFRLPDNPLIYVSPGFYKVTGYHSAEVIGHNCRFLQGPDTSEEAIDKIRAATSTGDHLTLELLNYRKDGTPFWNRLSLIPVLDEKELVTHYIGIQSDITDEYQAVRQKKLLGAQQGNLTKLSDMFSAMLSELLFVRESLQQEVPPDSSSLIQFTTILEKAIEDFKTVDVAEAVDSDTDFSVYNG